MFDVDTYLARLNYSGPTEPTAHVLQDLHKRHLMTVPFDSSRYADRGMAVLEKVDIDVDATFDRVIVRGEGGSCFDLSGLFRRLLEKLGFDVMIMAAGIRGPDGCFGLDIEHMFLGVHLDGELWLVDVGFPGPSFIEPIRLIDDVQEQYGCAYRLPERDGYRVLERRGRQGEWQAIYRFEVKSRGLAEWGTLTGLSADEGWKWEGEVVAAGTVIRARTFNNGQMILIGRRYLKIDGGHEHVRTLIDNDEYQSVIKHILRQNA